MPEYHMTKNGVAFTLERCSIQLQKLCEVWRQFLTPILIFFTFLMISLAMMIATLLVVALDHHITK